MIEKTENPRAGRVDEADDCAARGRRLDQAGSRVRGVAMGAPG